MILGPLIRFATATATKEASVANLINGATIIIYDSQFLLTRKLPILHLY